MLMSAVPVRQFLSLPASSEGGTVLITGATGFVGRHLVRSLLARGVDAGRLRLLVRDVARAREFGLPDASLVVGDLGDERTLNAACTGVGWTIHLAGALKALRASELMAVNGAGTRRLVRALIRASPKSRFVHVSSLAAAGPSVDGAASALPPAECRPVSHYGASKRAAEMEVAAAGDDLDWIVIRPPIVYGEGDEATRLLFRQAVGLLACVPWRARPISLIHVDDLVRAIELAAVADVHAAFVPIEGPERLDTDRLMDRIASACGRSARRLRIPIPIVQAAASVADAWARLRRRASFFNRDKVREIAAVGWTVDPEVARRVLGFVPEIGIDEGFRRTAEREGFAVGPAVAQPQQS